VWRLSVAIFKHEIHPDLKMAHNFANQDFALGTQTTHCLRNHYCSACTFKNKGAGDPARLRSSSMYILQKQGPLELNYQIRASRHFTTCCTYPGTAQIIIYTQANALNLCTNNSQ
jgi:hypothetical protein